jgi:hypothetical protein
MALPGHYINSSFSHCPVATLEEPELTLFVLAKILTKSHTDITPLTRVSQIAHFNCG